MIGSPKLGKGSEHAFRRLLLACESPYRADLPQILVRQRAIQLSSALLAAQDLE